MNWYKIAANPKTEKLWGTLLKNNNYYYLKIDNRIITPFIQLLDNDKVVSPEEVTEKKKRVGAHISVIKNDEGKKKKKKGVKVQELNKEFPFTLKGFESVKPDGWEGVKKVYFITVESPELEKLRKKYKLTGKIEKNHNFHITIAVEKENS